MAHGRHDAERGADERARHLRDQFLERVLFRAERTGVVAVEAGGMTGPMTEFMERGPVPIDRFEIGRRRRHLHEIVRRVVVGACTADAEIGAGGRDQRLGSWLNLARWRRDNRRRDLLGQAIALVGVEDGKALEERDRARLLAGFRGALLSSSGVKRSA